MSKSVLCLGDVPGRQVDSLLQRFGLSLLVLPDGAAIRGSFWGEPEAGLVGDRLYARVDTPVHSILHEACHYICMPPSRRAGLDTDAGGDYAEENAVCYLQILLAEYIPELGQQRLMQDMDAWGYSFRLGSARAWFNGDAEDARGWLQQHGLVDESGALFWRVRLTGLSLSDDGR